MGAVLNTLPIHDTDNLATLSPNRADWLTSHADATGLAVVEVERLWNRFKQLTGSTDQTKLHPENSAVPNELANDVFVKNYLKHFPRSKNDASSIPFGYFITVMSWLDRASIQDKLGAIYYYLNNGEPIDSVMISKLLKHVYRESKEEEIKTFSQKFMHQLAGNDQAKVNLQQFVSGVQRAIPAHELEELLKFDIIPPHLLDEANVASSLSASTTNLRDSSEFGVYDMVTDDQLRTIANRVSRRNWQRLATSLGFLEYDIEAYKVRNNGDASATMLELLRMWRDQDPSLATKNRLKRYLEQNGFEDVVDALH